MHTMDWMWFGDSGWIVLSRTCLGLVTAVVTQVYPRECHRQHHHEDHQEVAHGQKYFQRLASSQEDGDQGIREWRPPGEPLAWAVLILFKDNNTIDHNVHWYTELSDKPMLEAIRGNVQQPEPKWPTHQGGAQDDNQWRSNTNNASRLKGVYGLYLVNRKTRVDVRVWMIQVERPVHSNREGTRKKFQMAHDNTSLEEDVYIYRACHSKQIQPRDTPPGGW